MKTFDDFTRRFFDGDGNLSGGGMTPFTPKPKDTNSDSEFVVPECWKPKTFFQGRFLGFALNNTVGDYSEELRAAIGDCLGDLRDQHTITKTEIIFDGNLNFTITAGESSATATSDNFSLATEVNMQNVNIAVDGENLPLIQTGSYTGMTARLMSRMSSESVNPDVYSYFVHLSHLANTFTNGAHHVVLGVVTQRTDLELKTYKELTLAGGKTSPIVENKMLPKTPEELAFALLAGAPLEFSHETPSHETPIDGGDHHISN